MTNDKKMFKEIYKNSGTVNILNTHFDKHLTTFLTKAFTSAFTSTPIFTISLKNLQSSRHYH